MNRDMVIRFWQICLSHAKSSLREEVDLIRFATDSDFFDFICDKAKGWVDIHDNGDDFAKSVEFYGRVSADVYNYTNKRKSRRSNSTQRTKDIGDIYRKLDYCERE